MCKHLDLGGENKYTGNDGIRRVAAALCDVQRNGDWQLQIGSESSSHFKMHSVGHSNLAMLIRARSHGISASSMRGVED
jgi:hypothetical protein